MAGRLESKNKQPAGKPGGLFGFAALSPFASRKDVLSAADAPFRGAKGDNMPVRHQV